MRCVLRGGIIWCALPHEYPALADGLSLLLVVLKYFVIVQTLKDIVELPVHQAVKLAREIVQCQQSDFS